MGTLHLVSRPSPLRLDLRYASGKPILKRERIVSAAERLLAAGAGDVSMRAVASALGVNVRGLGPYEDCLPRTDGGSCSSSFQPHQDSVRQGGCYFVRPTSRRNSQATWPDKGIADSQSNCMSRSPKGHQGMSYLGLRSKHVTPQTPMGSIVNLDKRGVVA